MKLLSAGKLEKIARGKFKILNVMAGWNDSILYICNDCFYDFSGDPIKSKGRILGESRFSIWFDADRKKGAAKRLFGGWATKSKD